MTRRLCLAALALTACGTVPLPDEEEVLAESSRPSLESSVLRGAPLDLGSPAATLTGALPTAPSRDADLAVTVPLGPHAIEATQVVVGRLRTDGRLSLRLPAAEVLSAALVEPLDTTFASAEGCEGTLQAQPTNAGVFVVSSFLVDPDNVRPDVPRATVVESSTDASGARGHRLLRVFADRATSITGTLTCPYLDKRLDVHLRPGWNVVREDWTSTPERLRTGYSTSGEFTAELAVRWLY